MDELDLLKKDWKKKEHSFAQVSDGEINKMTHRNSSSIVKWLLIISIVEFSFWGFITLFFNDDQYQVKLHRYGLEDCMFWVNVVNYIILVVFIFLFYKNYRTISTTDSTRQLMKNILNTRKTVQYYIWYNLGIVAINIILSILMLFYHNDQMKSMMENAAEKGHQELFLIMCIGVSLLFILIIIGLFWLFYRLLYGILLRKLNANYKELKKSDLE
ncbi:hypothetical protein [Flavobacterium sp.]|uniref:hypothetical protein n=1 Tax=Flavobacterium sp. TaxID=239 RepID=UPI0039E25C93